MKDVIIASAVRTAIGKAPRGALRTTRPDDLGGVCDQWGAGAGAAARPVGD